MGESNLNLSSRAKIVLGLLGIPSMRAFRRVSGLSENTTNGLFYGRHLCRRSCFARAVETVLSAYEARKDLMFPAERMFVKAWINHWRNDMLKNGLIVTRPNIRLKNPSAKLVKTWKRNQAQRKRLLKVIAKGWVPIKDPVIKG